MAKQGISQVGVAGLLCPWCLLVVQRLPDGGGPARGLARHVQVVHPERAS